MRRSARSAPRGTPVLTIRCKAPIGRLRIRAGTRHVPTIRALQAMLRAFKTQGRWDLLQALQDRRITPLYALSLFRHQRLDEIPESRVVPPFREAAYAWSDLRESPSHRRATRATFRRLPAGAIGDLPELLQRVRAAWPHRTWNMAREHVSGFLRDELGADHAVYRSVRKLRPWPASAREKGRARSPDEARAVAKKLGGVLGRMWWTLCTTGMRPVEYWGGGWTDGLGAILIPSAKRRGRTAGQVRVVPRLAPPVVPAVGERWFRRKLNEAAPGVLIYDARRSYARWLEEARLIDTNRDAYMGHGPKTVRDLYPAGILPGQLEADRAAVAAYIGDNPHLLEILA